MSKGRRSSSGGGLLSKANIIKMVVGAAVTIFIFKKLEKSAADATQKSSITNQVASTLGFTGPGIA
jgi:hypothetical protein